MGVVDYLLRFLNFRGELSASSRMLLYFLLCSCQGVVVISGHGDNLLALLIALLLVVYKTVYFSL